LFDVERSSEERWGQIRRSLERVLQGIELGPLQDEHSGSESAEPGAEAALMEVVSFPLGQEKYAVESGYLREVSTAEGLVPVPCTPPFVAGIVNVRGQIYSVLDLRTLFGLQASSQERRWVLLLEAEDMELGILADDVPAVLRISREALQPPLPASSVPAGHVIGVTTDAMIVLDARKVLSDPAILVHDEISLD